MCWLRDQAAGYKGTLNKNFYYRFAFAYRYSYTGERAGETCAGVALKHR